MPKRLRQQRRGKGKQVFRAPSFHFKAKSQYRNYDKVEKEDVMRGQVVDLINDPGRSAPIMILKYDDGSYVTVPAPYGIKVGDAVSAGSNAEPKIGNILPLRKIPPGTEVFNIESMPGDGGKFVRASGSSARIIGHEGNRVTIRFPSKAFKILSPECRAMVGVVAGFGRKEKPIVKAGRNYYIRAKARGKYWPNVCGVAMNAINHPHGGKRRSTQKSKKLTVSRNAPPGAKVGSIAAKRTGRKKVI
jgi:large subunit ribosomal protein L2